MLPWIENYPVDGGQDDLDIDKVDYEDEDHFLKKEGD